LGRIQRVNWEWRTRPEQNEQQIPHPQKTRVRD
jgi:hypothetical protein